MAADPVAADPDKQTALPARGAVSLCGGLLIVPGPSTQADSLLLASLEPCSDACFGVVGSPADFGYRRSLTFDPPAIQRLCADMQLAREIGGIPIVVE
jgi:hypothetical protein